MWVVLRAVPHRENIYGRLVDRWSGTRLPVDLGVQVLYCLGSIPYEKGAKFKLYFWLNDRW